jgi:hypothetical protein
MVRYNSPSPVLELSLCGSSPSLTPDLLGMHEAPGGVPLLSVLDWLGYHCGPGGRRGTIAITIPMVWYPKLQHACVGDDFLVKLASASRCTRAYRPL